METANGLLLVDGPASALSRLSRNSGYKLGVVLLVTVADIHQLTVRYGRFTALHEFSVSIPRGCVGLLGPNGAGKTTLLKTLLGFVEPAGGGGTVLGHRIGSEGERIRQSVGYMPEQDCHIPGLNAVQFVAYAGELGGLPTNQALRRAHEVLEYCGLGEARYRLVETYSTGMKQRIKLAQALVHGPRLLLLDEPTNGLDPRGREEMLKLVQSLSHERGVDVLVSSHLLPDIERTCDEVIVLLRGKLRAQGKVRDLKKLPNQAMDLELGEFSPAFVEALAGERVTVLGSNLNHCRVAGPQDAEGLARAVFTAARRTRTQVRQMSLAERSLEEAFMEAVDA